MDDYVVWLLIGAVIPGLIGGVLGEKKGQPVGGFLFGYILGPIGWLIVVLSKDLRAKCPHCFGTVDRQATKCMHCASDLAGNIPDTIQDEQGFSLTLLSIYTTLFLTPILVVIWILKPIIFLYFFIAIAGIGSLLILFKYRRQTLHYFRGINIPTFRKFARHNNFICNQVPIGKMSLNGIKISRRHLAWLISYPCANCGEILESDFTNMGTLESCPSCMSKVQVPDPREYGYSTTRL